VDDPVVVAGFLSQHPFASLISEQGGEPFVTHLPLLFDSAAGSAGQLVGHMARANPHARSLRERSSALAIFHGPHAFVSSRWYVEQPAVPTWNYAVAHAAGRVRIVEDRAWLNQLLDRMLARFEPHGSAAGSAADRAHREQLLPGIVGLVLEIESLQLKFKLGQNRSRADRAAAAQALLATEDPDSRRTGEMMLAALQAESPRT
jgi:transcriptional regulator